MCAAAIRALAWGASHSCSVQPWYSLALTRSPSHLFSRHLRLCASPGPPYLSPLSTYHPFLPPISVFSSVYLPLPSPPSLYLSNALLPSHIILFLRTFPFLLLLSSLSTYHPSLHPISVSPSVHSPSLPSFPPSPPTARPSIPYQALPPYTFLFPSHFPSLSTYDPSLPPIPVFPSVPSLSLSSFLLSI